MTRMQLFALPMLALASFSTAVRGQVQSRPAWGSACRGAPPLVRVAFRSQSGDWTNDDMHVYVVWASRDSTQVPLRPALFRPVSLLSSDRSLCDGVPALNVSAHRVLLFLRRNARPDGDRLSVVLLDLRRRVVLSAIDDLGEYFGYADRPFVLRRGGQFEVLMVRDVIDDGSHSAKGMPVPDWRVITAVGDQLQSRWRP